MAPSQKLQSGPVHSVPCPPPPLPLALPPMGPIPHVALGHRSCPIEAGAELGSPAPPAVSATWQPAPCPVLPPSPPSEDQLPPGFPNIDMGPQLKVVERTRTATMLCAASGNPDPEITWFKDFLPVDPSASNGRIKQLRSGERRGLGGCGLGVAGGGRGRVAGGGQRLQRPSPGG